MIVTEFATVGEPYWSDRPAVLIGAGPSLKGVDLSVLKGHCYAVAIKSMLFECPWADVGFGLDTTDFMRWWDRFDSAGLPVWWAVPERWELPSPQVPQCLHFLRRLSPAQLSDEPSTIYTGGTSGYGAIGFAKHKRAKRVVLFGYDYCGKPNENGRTDWHVNESHYAKHGYHAPNWLEWAKRFDVLVPKLAHLGIEVINASPDSRITAFPKVSIEEGIRLVSRGLSAPLPSRTQAHPADAARASEAAPA